MNWYPIDNKMETPFGAFVCPAGWEEVAQNGDSKQLIRMLEAMYEWGRTSSEDADLVFKLWLSLNAPKP